MLNLNENLLLRNQILHKEVFHRLDFTFYNTIKTKKRIKVQKIRPKPYTNNTIQHAHGKKPFFKQLSKTLQKNRDTRVPLQNMSQTTKKQKQSKS